MCFNTICQSESIRVKLSQVVCRLVLAGPGQIVCVDTMCPSESVGWLELVGWSVGWLVGWVGGLDQTKLGRVFDTICQSESS